MFRKLSRSQSAGSGPRLLARPAAQPISSEGAGRARRPDGRQMLLGERRSALSSIQQLKVVREVN